MAIFERDAILNDLRSSIAEISFTKVDGENRIMRCTLREDFLPPYYKTKKEEEKKYHEDNPEVIAAWDIEKKDWRSFRVDSVKYVQDITEKY